MRYILLLIISTHIFAQMQNSSISTYYNSVDFISSYNKKSASFHGVGGDFNYNNSQYKLTYEYGTIYTKQPPMSEDAKREKLHLKYGYSLNNYKINLNYINIINDNQAITDNGRAYGLGLTYIFNKKFSTNITQFYTDYEDFNVYQSDFKLEYKTKLENVKLKLSSITKYIQIDEENTNSFTKNAKATYLNTGIKVNASYKSYHFGAGVYFGERAFDIINDGFKIQNRPMECSRTYTVMIGKDISDFVLHLGYAHNETTELPMQNKNVKVNVIRLIGKYKF